MVCNITVPLTDPSERITDFQVIETNAQNEATISYVIPRRGVFFYSFSMEAEVWTLDDIPLCKRPQQASKQIDSVIEFPGLLSLEYKRPSDLTQPNKIEEDSIYAIGTSPP